MYIFLTYFAERNFRSHFPHKFLKALANKICNIVQFPCRKMKTFLFARIISEKITSSERPSGGEYCICFPAQAILRWSLNPSHRQSFLLASISAQTIRISYLLQYLDKQSLLCNFCISALAFSLLQIQHKLSSLLVLIPTQTIFPTCFNPKINLRYLCNFSSFSFYSSED